MKRLFKFRAYGKVYKLTAKQLNSAFNIVASMVILKNANA